MVSLNSFALVKLHREFQYIYKKGKNAHSNSVVLFFLPSTTTKKVGFTATKKIGNAVCRNRAKRRLRALFYQNAPLLKDGTYIFVAKDNINNTNHADLSQDMQKVIKRLGLYA